MKVKIEFTVDIDTDVLTQYMTELGALGESKRDFVKSTMIAGVITPVISYPVGFFSAY